MLGAFPELSAIGIVDGAVGTGRLIRHREILDALARGVAVFGAAGLGAIRAAELDGHGMVGVGRVYLGYRSGRLKDDADVLGDAGTISMADLEATLKVLASLRAIDARDQARILEIARDIHHADRSWERLAAALAPGEADRLRAHRVRQQRDDARGAPCAHGRTPVLPACHALRPDPFPVRFPPAARLIDTPFS